MPCAAKRMPHVPAYHTDRRHGKRRAIIVGVVVHTSGGVVTKFVVDVMPQKSRAVGYIPLAAGACG